MNRLHHVKIASTDPEAVDRFLRLVAELPAGWRLGDGPASAATPPGKSLSQPTLTSDDVLAARAAGAVDGFIVGDEKSSQFQVLRGDTSQIWAAAIGTRDVARAHALCVAHGFDATPIDVTPWGDGQAVRFFFARAGGVMFEVMSVERVSAPPPAR
ncbi:MAG TPA: hypothetical protein VFT98_05935 [Myxococcota bacterium]|nr:hypothetical protein [Myxococcota bacterium]